jgi:alanine racemase
MRSRAVRCDVNLDQIRASAERIRGQTRVRVLAVIKADAYGLGAVRVADAIASVVDEFAYFWIHEAREVGRGGILIGPPDAEAAVFEELAVRPTVGNLEDARRLSGIAAAASLDTGMQRFGCDAHELDEILRLCRIDEIHTHASGLPAVERFRLLAGGRGLPLLAASSSLLAESSAWLDGVRPGVALYRGALRVTTTLHSARASSGPAGYTGIESPYVGIILAGYSNGLAPASVLINGRRQTILEVGMNSSFVSVDAADRCGDEVVLLGGDLTEAQLSAELRVREHEVLCRYGSMGQRHYRTRLDATPTARTQEPAAVEALPN